jgi:hypothetical protein
LERGQVAGEKLYDADAARVTWRPATAVMLAITTVVAAPITSDVDRSALNRDFADEGPGTRKTSS